MIKRKPGRPRKVEQSVEGAIPEKRRRGRPRKNPVAEAATPMAAESKPLSCYMIETGSGEPHFLEGDQYTFHSNGDLSLYRKGESIASFRNWLSIVKMEDTVEPPKVETMTAPQPENISNTYQMMENGGLTGAGQPVDGVHVSVSPNGAQTVTFGNGVQLVEADRPE